MNDQELQIFTRWLSNSLVYRLDYREFILVFPQFSDLFFLSFDVCIHESTLNRSVCI